MKNTYPILALLLSSLLLQACKKDDTQPLTIANVLTNGDMEASPYTNWGTYMGKVSAVDPNKYIVDYTAEAASSPTHSIKVTCDAANNDSTYQYMQQSFTISSIPVGAKLTLRAKIKTSNVQGNGIALAMGGNQVVNNQGKSTFYTSTEGKTAITGTKDFTEYTITYDSFPANTTNVYVLLFFLPKTTGTAYYDDVSLQIN